MDRLKALNYKRGGVKRQLTSFVNFVKQPVIDRSQLEERYSRIPEVWSKFQELSLDIECILLEEEKTTQHEEHVAGEAAYESSYYKALAAARDRLDKEKKTIALTTESIDTGKQQNAIKLKLPPLVIQSFAGNYDQWLSFRDSFVKAVDEQQIPDVQKFQILKGLLKDDALKIVSALEATDSNYKVAWELLENRYANNRLIKNTHIKGLFELPSITKGNQTSLRQLVDNIRMHTRSLQSLKQPVDKWDGMLIYLVMTKLDQATKEEWEKEIAEEREDDPSFEDLLKFLEKRSMIYEMIDKSKATPENTSIPKKEKKITLTSTINKYQDQGQQKQRTREGRQQDKARQNQQVQQGTQASQAPRTSQFQGKKVSFGCYYCKGNHALYKCESFSKLDTQERHAEVRQLRLCINCLRPNHTVKDCKSLSCRKCGGRHNTLLHRDTTQIDKLDNNNPDCQQNSETKQQDHQVISHCTPIQSRVLLSTAEVYVTDSEGKEHKCRALLDGGSQSNMLTEELVQRLKVKTRTVSFPISGVNQSRSIVRKATQVTLKSTVSRYVSKQEFLVVPNITEQLPQVQLDLNKMQIPDGIELADPNFHVTGKIDVLLGAGVFWKILRPGESVSIRGQPTFHNTCLGWIVGGDYDATTEKSVSLVCHLVTESGLREQIERFWNIEELDHQKIANDKQDFCEKHFEENYTRQEDGRFQVRLPQDTSILLGDSFNEAFKRLKTLEKRFVKQPELKEEYVKFLREYEEANHMTLLTKNDKGDIYYIPHQAVVKDTSITSKTRVVFDASSKTSLGTSLNDRLLPGPNLQKYLIGILIRFRCYQYVMTADIKQMFRQIVVDEKDRNLLRILWREDPKTPVQIYTLNTVTYGTSCAPFLAMRCIRQLSIDVRSKSPLLASILENDFYMDDMLTGADSIEELTTLQRGVSELLQSGQFCLRKWRTNEPSILKNLSPEKGEDFLVLDQDTVKTLGLLWNSKDDVLQYSSCIPVGDLSSKRKVLSAISRIYDPLGLIGPVLIVAKLFMQELWVRKVDWDNELPPDLQVKWNTYVRSLEGLTALSIPRNVNPNNVQQGITLYRFCDASERAYGACIYIASLDQCGKQQTRLLCSKSRVAPLSTISLPRLELNAARLLSRLVSFIREILRHKVIETHLWSDSTITLCWIATQPHKLKTFEANRVAEIRNLTKNDVWHYVPSQHNPADCLSRGITTERLTTFDLWWRGPHWISNVDDWPECPVSRQTVVTYNVTQVAYNVDSKLLNKFSSFTRLLRVVAYCKRFLNNLRGHKQFGTLSTDELEAARIIIFRWVQEDTFSYEVTQLRAGNLIDKKSALLMLRPFVDENGLIRVGGRLQNANLPQERKHPIILPAKHHLTNIVLRDEHIRLFHCGPKQLLNSIRGHYWPLSGAREARKVTRSCVACFKYRPKIPNLIMGDLPSSRVTESSRPFESVGVDYAGPIMVRESKRRGKIHISKGYVAVFVCFTTKAVHLELVSDLSTETFLAALRRFTARRGCCSSLYSDNGTNFVGAANEMREIQQFFEINEDTIKTTLAMQGITWSFIPPRAPHFGGLWESAVKIMKKHLFTVIKDLKYTYEEYYTFLAQIESIMNSRPLVPLSADPDDLSILTPSHFLIGSPMLEPPTRSHVNVSDTLLSRWQHTQKLRAHFWNRWKTEYLHNLQARTRWNKGSDTVHEGSMVLLVDDNAAPLSWPTGRIVKIFTGNDGVVRVAQVKTANGIFERSVKKLCILPIEIKNENNKAVDSDKVC